MIKNFKAGLIMALFASVSHAQTGLLYPDEMIKAAVRGDEAKVLESKSRAELAEKPQRGDRKSARALNTKGLADISAGSLNSAIESLTQAVRIDPLDAEIPSNLGYAYMKKGDYEQAKRALAQSISLQPGRGSAWATLAEAFARSGDIEKATACFNIAYTFSQNRDKTKEFLSKIVAENVDAKLTTAAKAALAAEGIKPLNDNKRQVAISTQYADAKAAYERNDFSTAFRLFKEVLDQGDSKAEYAIGVMYLKGEGVEKNIPKAIEYFRNSVEHNDPRSMNILGSAYLDGLYGIPVDKKRGVELLEKAAQSGFDPAVKKLQEVKAASSLPVSSECPPLDRAASDSYLSGLDGNTARAKTKAEVNRYISEYCNTLPNLFRGYVMNGLQRDDFRCVLSQQQINDLRNLSQTPADKAQKIANSAFEQIPQRCPSAMERRYQPRFLAIDAIEAKQQEAAAKAKEQEMRQLELAASKKAAEEKEKLEKENIRIKAQEQEKALVSKASQILIEKSAIPATSRILWGNNGELRYSNAIMDDSEGCLGRIAINIQSPIEYSPSAKGEFEKTDAYKIRIAEEKIKFDQAHPNPRLEKMQGAFGKFLGNPLIDGLRYDADKEVFQFNIASQNCRFKIPASIAAPARDAETVKKSIESLMPMVALEVSGDKVTAKYVVYFSKNGQITQAPLNYKINYSFSAAAASDAEKYLAKKAQKDRADQLENERKEYEKLDFVQKQVVNFERVNNGSRLCAVFAQQMRIVAFSNIDIAIRKRQFVDILSDARGAGCSMPF